MLDRVARFPKPIAVGIHGACLGGGFEFALACHYRVATDHPRRRSACPKYSWASCRRPAAASACPARGVRAALDMILAGKSERAAKALLGMVEAVPPPILAEINDRRRTAGWPAAGDRSVSVAVASWVSCSMASAGPTARLSRRSKQVLERTGGHYPAHSLRLRP